MSAKHAPGVFPAFVINLARAPSRLAGFKSCMAEHQWEVTTFNAIDRHDIIVTEKNKTGTVVQHRDNSSVRLQIVPTRTGSMSLGLGQIACALSHMELWKTIVDNDLPHACIFEDDAQIIKPWWGRPWPSTADFVFIGNRVLGMIPHDIESADQLDDFLASHPYVPLVPGCGTEAYFVTHSGAKKALRVMEEMYQPIDLQLLCCAHGTRLSKHYLQNERRPSMPELEMWTSSDYHTVHRNDCPSFVNDP